MALALVARVLRPLGCAAFAGGRPAAGVVAAAASVRFASADRRTSYENPLTGRYGAGEMSRIWSPHTKFRTWRRLWLALAQAQKELGLRISQEQIEEIRTNLDNIDFAEAERKEREIRHDVMSHVHALGVVAPNAKPILHLGATSAYVTDNADLILMRDSLIQVRRSLVRVIKLLRDAALRYRDVPTLGYTHLQPAQLTTVGKRMCLWLQDFIFDFHEVNRWVVDLPLLGVKGTTGTQASFLALFNGNHKKVSRLEARVCELMGFDRVLQVSGQTYTRKLDTLVLNTLSGVAASSHKFATDIRLLASVKEIEEPFESKQVGSSAMPYKRNPMRSERICALARYVMSLTDNASATHALQWFERTLDDSGNRRITIPQAFITSDIVLSLVANVLDGIQVWPRVIAARVAAELPFMATENILMACVKAGGDRQVLHEAIREHSMEAGRRVKEHGADNDLLQRIAADPRFAAVHGSLSEVLDPARYVGRAPQQVDEYLAELADPILREHAQDLQRNGGAEVTV